MPARDTGFVVKPRPSCSAVVQAALREPGAEAIRRAAEQGANFTCSEAFGPTPLDEEIMRGGPDRAQALLEAGADPNTRWLEGGDRHPLHGPPRAAFRARRDAALACAARVTERFR